LNELPASTPTITLTPTSTSTPTPSFTNTPIPFSQLNLEELTILEGDLPSGWNPMDASNEVPGLLDDVIPGNYSISRSFKSGEYTISVTIFVYENEDNVGLAYEQFIDLSKNVGMEPEETSEVGEKGFIYNGKLYAYPVVVMGFSRCHSAVFLTSGIVLLTQ